MSKGRLEFFSGGIMCVPAFTPAFINNGSDWDARGASAFAITCVTDAHTDAAVAK